jgi:quinoprotein glucose dehydrogenase
MGRMTRNPSGRWLASFVVLLLALISSGRAKAEPLTTNSLSTEALAALKQFQVPSKLKIDLWANEPFLQNPVAFNFDEKGRAYVCETFRLGQGVDDIRGIMDWLDEELASRSVSERLLEMKRHLGSRFPSYTNQSERIRLIEDANGRGQATRSTVFADQFNTALDGIGAGVLPWKGNVYYANIPNLWLLSDTNHDGVADTRKSLAYGFGVRVGFLGHDLHGLKMGPDGRIYFSIGDRGAYIKTSEGKVVDNCESGSVFRCNPDGSDLELFAYGLRNPQDLVFDELGNLFTGDNNSDSGDKARWVYVMEGSDNGWRVGYQFMENPYSRGPFNAEKLWYPSFPGQAAYIVPPIANVADGPSGVAYFPGTGLPDSFRNHFFLVDFRGGPANSGIHSFRLNPQGAGFKLIEDQHFIWNVLATDVKFGVDGGVYFTDWVEGWGMTGKGRIYRAHDPMTDSSKLVSETKRLLAEGMGKRSDAQLAKLLEHPDIRVRQAAQFELADRGITSLKNLSAIAAKNSSPLARLHAIWTIGQVCRNFQTPRQTPETQKALGLLTTLLEDESPEVRAQAAKIIGEQHIEAAPAKLISLLADSSSRVRSFAALSLGKLKCQHAVQPIFEMLRENNDVDPFLRHAGVMGLAGINDFPEILRGATNESDSVRMGCLLVMRRMRRDEMALFLRDRSPALVLEAARAIHDEPINGAMAELAGVITSPLLEKFSSSRILPESQPLGSSKDPGTWRHGGARSKSDSEALLRRVIDANLRLGSSDGATALVELAGKPDYASAMCAEALDALAHWEHPSGRDRVTGLWRPAVGHREAVPAVKALDAQLSGLLTTSNDVVRIAAMRAAAILKPPAGSRTISRLFADSSTSAEVKIEALHALEVLDRAALKQSLELGLKDSQESVRKAATQIQARLGDPQSFDTILSALDQGTIGEKQVALAALAASTNAQADTLLSTWLDKLQAGAVPKEVALDILTAAKSRSNNDIQEKLKKYESSKSPNDPLAQFQETLFGGDALKGRKVFFERPETQCVRCHKAGATAGSDVGPDLSHIASQHDRAYLLESVLLPNKQIAPGFDSVTVVLKSGDVLGGVLKSENETELVLASADAGITRIKKDQIQSRRKALSPMPEGFGQLLPKADLRDLIEFLSSLK